MSESRVCPWCMTEIVWDEELGPEEVCPHCQNELSDYRTMEIAGDPEEEEISFRAGSADSRSAKSARKIIPFERNGAGKDSEWEDGLQVKDRASLQYEEAVERCLEQQKEAPECPQCREYMVYAGDTGAIAAEQFASALPQGFAAPFLQAPFKLSMFVCPACFHASFMLAEEDRLKVLRSFGRQLEK